MRRDCQTSNDRFSSSAFFLHVTVYVPTSPAASLPDCVLCCLKSCLVGNLMSLQTLYPNTFLHSILTICFSWCDCLVTKWMAGGNCMLAHISEMTEMLIFFKKCFRGSRKSLLSALLHWDTLKCGCVLFFPIFTNLKVLKIVLLFWALMFDDTLWVTLIWGQWCWLAVITWAFIGLILDHQHSRHRTI